MKAVHKILMAALALGCAVTMVGCSSSSGSGTSTSPNWNVTTSSAIEKNYLTYWRTHTEETAYTVTYATGTNTSYCIEYDTATAVYTTKFYIDGEDYNWNADAVPEDFRKDEKEPVYVYETHLEISGVYKISGASEGESFTNVIDTVCKFKMADSSLAPVYSYQDQKCSSPAAITASSAAGAYTQTDAVYETYYNKDTTKAYVKMTDRANDNAVTEKTVSTGGGYVFDNCQLGIALRALTYSGSKSFKIFSPQSFGSANITATFGSSTELKSADEDNTNDQAAIDALKNVTDGDGNKVSDYIFYDYTSSSTSENDEATTKNIYYTPVELSAENGVTPVYNYATIEDTEINSTRGILLQISDPLSYGMGTLTYTLKSINLVGAASTD